ncbi:MAG: hypothetical protein Kow0077_03160 [Anaerolineae bacterium]
MSKRPSRHVTGRFDGELPPPLEREPKGNRVRRPTLLLILGLLLGMLSAAATAAVALILLLRPAPATTHNAIWLGISWGQNVHADAEVQALVQELRDNEIDTLYIWTTWLQEDGTWSETTFEHLGAFVQQVRRFYPEARLDAWIGLPVEVPAYRLDDEELRTEVVQFCADALTRFGFDGIHMNAEPVWNGDENFIALLRDIKLAIGEDAVLSVAVPPDWNTGVPDVPVGPYTTVDAHWSQEYKQRVAFLADEIAIMAYNSGLSSAVDYQKWMAYQVTRYLTAITELDLETQIIVGIPTYDAEPPGHDPAAESIPAAIAGILDGLAQSGDAAEQVRGVGVYAQWSTDPLEWALFRQYWLRRDSPSTGS